jgi:hypothetical protein
MTERTASISSSKSSSKNESIQSQNNASEEGVFQFSPEIDQHLFSGPARTAERFPTLRPSQRLLPQISREQHPSNQGGSSSNFLSLESILSDAISSQALTGQLPSLVGLGISQIAQGHDNKQSQLDKQHSINRLATGSISLPQSYDRGFKHSYSPQPPGRDTRDRLQVADVPFEAPGRFEMELSDLEHSSEQPREVSEQQYSNLEHRSGQFPVTSRLHPSNPQQNLERTGPIFREQTIDDLLPPRSSSASSPTRSNVSLNVHPSTRRQNYSIRRPSFGTLSHISSAEDNLYEHSQNTIQQTFNQRIHALNEANLSMISRVDESDPAFKEWWNHFVRAQIEKWLREMFATGYQLNPLPQDDDLWRQVDGMPGTPRVGAVVDVGSLVDEGVLEPIAAGPPGTISPLVLPAAYEAVVSSIAASARHRNAQYEACTTDSNTDGAGGDMAARNLSTLEGAAVLLPDTTSQAANTSSNQNQMPPQPRLAYSHLTSTPSYSGIRTLIERQDSRTTIHDTSRSLDNTSQMQTQAPTQAQLPDLTTQTSKALRRRSSPAAPSRRRLEFTPARPPPPPPPSSTAPTPIDITTPRRTTLNTLRSLLPPLFTSAPTSAAVSTPSPLNLSKSQAAALSTGSPQHSTTRQRSIPHFRSHTAELPVPPVLTLTPLAARPISASTWSASGAGTSAGAGSGSGVGERRGEGSVRGRQSFRERMTSATAAEEDVDHLDLILGDAISDDGM